MPHALKSPLLNAHQPMSCLARSGSSLQKRQSRSLKSSWCNTMHGCKQEVHVQVSLATCPGRTRKKSMSPSSSHFVTDSNFKQASASSAEGRNMGVRYRQSSYNQWLFSHLSFRRHGNISFSASQRSRTDFLTRSFWRRSHPDAHSLQPTCFSKSKQHSHSNAAYQHASRA